VKLSPLSTPAVIRIPLNPIAEALLPGSVTVFPVTLAFIVPVSASALSEDCQTETIPISAVSAGQRYTSVGEHAVHAFLSKPFDGDTLLKVLEEVLQ
jgi:hypothetical protein